MGHSGMKVRIFGSGTFESKWVPRPRGWLNHTFLCDGLVAVHDVWYDQGYRHAVAYDHGVIDRYTVLDWCQLHAPGSHMLHPSGAVLFTDEAVTMDFKREMMHV